MTQSTLERGMARVRAAWGPLSTPLVAECRDVLEGLATAPTSEPWLAALIAEAPPSRELHRDPDHGFVLLAHAEGAGLYRPPHDHGAAWVVYAVQHGEVEMRTYGRVETPDGARLVRRDVARLRAGDVAAYLPGDIHDTRCLSGAALLFRFTERDLRQEDRDGRLTRYPAEDDCGPVGR